MPGMDGFINFNGTLEGSIAGGGGGDVTDVKVRDSQETTFESVVNEEGVAEIDLISYVRRNELSQELMILENNIDTELERKQNIYDYSTDEQLTGQKWIDGKDIYQKTFTGNLINNTLTIDITDLNIDNAWIKDGCYDIGVTKLALNEYITGSAGCYTHLNTGTTPPVIDCRNNVAATSTIYVTILYTKNTEV